MKWVPKMITLSDIHFHRTIIQKYQPDKKNPFMFPLLIYFRNPGIFLTNKINMEVLLQLTFQHLDMMPSLIAKSVQGTRAFFSRLNNENLIMQSIIRSTRSKNIDTKNRMTIVLKKIILPLLPKTDTALYHQLSEQNSNYDRYGQISQQYLLTQSHRTSLEILRESSVLLNYRTQPTIHNQVKGTVNNRISPEILRQSNVTQHTIHNNQVNRTVNNWISNTPSVNENIFRSKFTGFSFIPRKESLLGGEVNFSFNTFGNMEQEMGLIRKVVEETREAIIENNRSSGDGDTTRQIDLHQLSDHVYHLIDRRIKVERERRGYL